MRAIRLFIAEEEGTKGKASAGQERRQAPAAAEEKQPTSGKYEISEQPSAVVREEDFAKQLRMARYLAASVCRRHGRWSRSYRQRRLNRRDPLERRGVKAKYNRRNKSLGGGIDKGKAPDWAAGSQAAVQPIRVGEASNRLRLGVRLFQRAP
jgi:hypothetical protein